MFAEAQLSTGDSAIVFLVAFGIGLLGLGCVIRLALTADRRRARTRAPTASRGATAAPEAPVPGGQVVRRDRLAPVPAWVDELEWGEELPVSRMAPEALEPLGRRLRASRRLRIAEERVGFELGRLPADRWMIERWVPLDRHRVPFLVAGPTGVFALWPSENVWTMDDVGVLQRATDELARLLPGYRGPIRAAVVLAFDPMAPRAWHRGIDGAGGWILGIDVLQPWLFGFETQAGLADGDIACLRRRAESFEPTRPPGRLPAAPNWG
jgi:hypothetical protein